MKSKKTDRSSWAIGGGVVAGVGFGFFLLPNALAFVGAILLGLGVGLMFSTFTK